MKIEKKTHPSKAFLKRKINKYFSNAPHVWWKKIVPSFMIKRLGIFDITSSMLIADICQMKLWKAGLSIFQKLSRLFIQHISALQDRELCPLKRLRNKTNYTIDTGYKSTKNSLIKGKENFKKLLQNSLMFHNHNALQNGTFLKENY